MADKPSEFEKKVEEAMSEIMEQHQHNHPLYQDTRIQKKLIDKENQRAAFVLFEQIDTDRCTPEGEGWLGDQYRYSVWYLQGEQKPKMLYEDHAYQRRTKSGLTGSRGRDCSIYLKELLEDGVIAEITPQNIEGGEWSKTKVKINLEGRIEEPEDFMEQAENLVKRIGRKLGYDYLRGKEQLKGKNIAALVWGTENGSDYGYDTVYLVWKKKGEINYKTITDSRMTKDYLRVDSIKEDQEKIIVNVKGQEYTISKESL